MAAKQIKRIDEVGCGGGKRRWNVFLKGPHLFYGQQITDVRWMLLDDVTKMV
jgi:hypothetical protein